MESFVNRIGQWGAQVRERWQQLSLNQKVLFSAVIALLLVTLVILLARGKGETGLAPLYTELEQKDAADIVEKLQEYKVPHKLADNGSTILVPETVRDSTRLKLAADDLPRGEKGFELFQETSFGETQTDKKVKYQAALQGELARTIQSIDKIKAARVNLALPEPSLFSENEGVPKASVVINTQEGESLSPREVKAIVNLVANSVERLDPENVVIVDQNGNLVSENLPDYQASSSDQVRMQLAMKREFEKEKEQAIQSMLDKTLGQNNAVVRVNAELDFDEKEQVEERYSHDPLGPFFESQQVKKESGTDTTGAQPGIPGTDNNIPQYTEVAAPGGTSTYDKSEKTTNYLVNKTETVTKFSPGDVKYDYLTVSVFVNNAGTRNASLGETDQEKQETIRNIVAAACGLRENRPEENVHLEENISVEFIDFYTPPGKDTPTGLVPRLLASPLTPWVMALLATLVVMLVLMLRKRRAETPVEEEIGSEFEAMVEEEIKLEDLIDRNMTPEEREKQRIRREIEKLVDENPENAAQVIKTWLVEDTR